jgi:triosephosphate isomerase
MKTGKKIIVANWKMNPATAAEARALFAKTKRAASRLEKVETVICPPFPYLGLFAHSGTTRVSLGAQDVFYSNSGRATGEVSPEQLTDLGVSSVIVGHSERRALGETNDMVAKKALAALKEGLRVILCIGERERDPDGRFYDVLSEQLASSLAQVPRRFLGDLCVAYEPVFAIGKSFRDAMTPRDIRETSLFLKKTLTDLYDRESGTALPILYGGSVEEANTAAVITEGGADGLLVGHKSLDAEAFTKMLTAANGI